MDKQEAEDLIKYMDNVANHVPNGLSHLSDAITFAMLELIVYWRTRVKQNDYEKALAFGKSIPVFKNFESADFNNWLLEDEEHLKYWPLY
jgi:hypothetical protein